MASKLQFVVADRSHDAGIRALLRDNPMAGDIRLSFQTEPSYFDAAAVEGEHHSIVAIEGERVVCVGGVSICSRYLNGKPSRVGYLGRLRIASSHAGRFDIIRRGYQTFRELHHSLRLAACFTSIAADNAPARRLFERGLSGLPTYTFAGDLETFVIPTNRRFAATRIERERIREEKLQVIRGSPDTAETLIALVAQSDSAFQFAPQSAPADLAVGPTVANMHVLVANGQPVGVAAVWNQRAFKQTVVCGYSPRLRMLRPLVNAIAHLGRGLPLPPMGSELSQAFASHLALTTLDRPEWMAILLRSLLSTASNQGNTMLAIGWDARDPRSTWVRRRFRPLVYRTRLYTVQWPEESPSFVPDGRLLNPEIALL